ncbi:hypothetical protein FRC07_011322 [Ceratobasidium sp. 392]|nr:hypothetical protein FRC07_011322 [Ceratobasidium sp. 392]
MREIVIWCLQLEISHEDVNALEGKIQQWVQDYERLYYRYDHDRLPTCVLTIHALLHIPYYIRRTGPLSGTWSFVMERFCGYLLRPALSNRLRPFDALDNYIRRRAQMQAVAKIFDMPELVRPLTNLALVHGELISSKEKIYDFKDDIVLGQPVKAIPRPPIQLKRQMTKYFGVAEGPAHGEGPRPTFAELIDKLDFSTLVSYGRFRLASMGDRIRTAELVRKNPINRDNSFVRYEALPDRNAQRPRDPDRAIRRIYYARVEKVYYIEFIRNQETNERVPYLLALVQDCNTPNGVDASKPEHPIVTYNQLKSPEIIDLGAIQAAIGRVRVGGRNTWAIIDRSNGARTQFNDPAGIPDPDLE